MLDLSPRFALSPRFLALPVIALGVIIALAQFGRDLPANTLASGPAIKAVNCANIGDKPTRACAVARDTTTVKNTVQ